MSITSTTTIKIKDPSALYLDMQNANISKNIDATSAAFYSTDGKFEVAGNVSSLIKAFSIPSSIFSGSDNLVKIDLSNVENIPDSFLKKCSGLEKVILDESRIIGKESFKDCTTLSSINLNMRDNLEKIDDNAFENCISLTAINFSSSKNMTKIEKEAFKNCDGVTTLTLYNCRILNEIGPSAFYDCSSLSSINLLYCNNISSINDYAFYGCAFNEIKFPEYCKLEKIGDNAFNGCEITSMLLPDTLTSMVASGDLCSGSLATISACYISAYEGCMGWKTSADINDETSGVTKYGAIGSGATLIKHKTSVVTVLREEYIGTYSNNDEYYKVYHNMYDFINAIRITGRPALIMTGKTIMCQIDIDNYINEPKVLGFDDDFKNDVLKPLKLLCYDGRDDFNDNIRDVKSIVEKFNSQYGTKCSNSTVYESKYWGYFDSRNDENKSFKGNLEGNIAFTFCSFNGNLNNSINTSKITDLLSRIKYVFSCHAANMLSPSKTILSSTDRSKLNNIELAMINTDGGKYYYTLNRDRLKEWLKYEMDNNSYYKRYLNEYKKANSRTYYETVLDSKYFKWYSYNANETNELSEFLTAVALTKCKVFICFTKNENELSDIDDDYLYEKKIIALRLVNLADSDFAIMKNYFASYAFTQSTYFNKEGKTGYELSSGSYYGIPTIALVKCADDISPVDVEFDNTFTIATFLKDLITNVIAADTAKDATDKFTSGNVKKWLNDKNI